MDDLYTLSDSQILKSIGNKLKSVRLKQNITQENLAESCSISRSSVQKIENGEIGSFESFLRILRTLGLLDELSHLCSEEQMSPSEYYEFKNSLMKKKRLRAERQTTKKREELEW